jgi:hypothetical protein
MEKLEVPSRRGPRELEVDTPTFDDPFITRHLTKEMTKIETNKH